MSYQALYVLIRKYFTQLIKYTPATNRSKKSKLDFSVAVPVIDTVPPNLVQIAAGENEINRRIQCFVEKKREEIDINNIMDFTAIKEARTPCLDEDNSTCARINSVIVKQEHSKCHLRVRRTENRIGPQIKPDYLYALDKLMSQAHPSTTEIKRERCDTEPISNLHHTQPSQQISAAFQERLRNVEEYLSVSDSGVRNFHQRIKNIEDRILYLESISPEYKHFLINPVPSPHLQLKVPKNNPESTAPKRKSYTADELDAIIEQLEQRTHPTGEDLNSGGGDSLS